MKTDRRFLPGDDVEVLYPPDGSDGETVGTVKGTIFDGRVKVKFSNGNIVEIPIGDLTRLNK